ncbi:MAG: outer membrane beta-barrel protein [Ferruginibacter sp.]
MEKKFYPDNFEQLLKESTDNFRMYPSKRVWHSIYNDLHPSRKWPSFAIWILLISSIVYIGVSNKNQGSQIKNQSALADNIARNVVSVSEMPNTNNINGHVTDADRTGNSTPVKVQAIAPKSFSSIASNDAKNKLNPVNNNNSQADQQTVALTSLKNSKTASPEYKTYSSIRGNGQDVNISDPEINTATASQKEVAAVVSVDDINNLITSKKEPAVTGAEAKKTDAETKNKVAINDKNNTAEKEWIEDYAFHNKPFASKWKSRASYQFYFTPSIGYRIFSKNSDYNPVSQALVATTGNVQDYKDAFSHSAAVNVEIGGNILYSISKSWNFKAGIQLNYTNYNINAYELKHPTMTTLTLNDLNTGLPILDPRATTLANISGVASTKLNNNTYQLSLPIGADIKLAGKNNLKWYAGATIQPTYVTGGNAYLASSDLKNYVTDKSLIRKWNLNAGIETFISYKTQGGLIINAGPQFRYQFLSTYSKQYTYNERLYNLGLKIGITTRF